MLKLLLTQSPAQRDSHMTEPQTYGVVREVGVEAAMRDGAVVRADVYRPDAAAPQHNRRR